MSGSKLSAALKDPTDQGPSRQSLVMAFGHPLDLHWARAQTLTGHHRNILVKMVKLARPLRQNFQVPEACDQNIHPRTIDSPNWQSQCFTPLSSIISLRPYDLFYPDWTTAKLSRSFYPWLFRRFSEWGEKNLMAFKTILWYPKLSSTWEVPARLQHTSTKKLGR